MSQTYPVLLRLPPASDPAEAFEAAGIRATEWLMLFSFLFQALPFARLCLNLFTGSPFDGRSLGGHHEGEQRASVGVIQLLGGMG